MLELRELLRAPARSRLLDDGSDAKPLPVRRHDGVVARAPGARGVRIARRAARELEPDHRLAGFEDAAGERLEDVGQVGHDLRERPADVILGAALVEPRQRLVDPHVAEVAVPEAEPDRRAAVERVQERGNPLRLAEDRLGGVAHHPECTPASLRQHPRIHLMLDRRHF